MLDVVDFCQFFTDFVDLGCVFQRLMERVVVK